MDEMNLFNLDTSDDVILGTLPENATMQQMLDFMVLTVLQNLKDVKLAFKGGWMLNQIIPNESRQTHDIDFSIDTGGNYEKVKIVLKAIGDYFIKLGLVDSYKVKETIKETMSGGIDFYADDGSKILGVDVGWHQLTYGTKIYNLSIGDLNAWSIERMLSDKIHAIFTPKRFRRVKDLYDVYVILEQFDVDFKSFKKNLDDRGDIDLNKTPFRDEVLVQYRHAWNKLNLLSVDDDNLPKPDFDDVIGRLADFCAILCGCNRNYTKWDCKKKRWLYDKES